MANTICFFGQLTAAKAGKTGLAPTIAVDRISRSDGTRTALDVSAIAVHEARYGVYYFTLPDADLQSYDYLAYFLTADATVDQKEVPALWVRWSEGVATDANGLVLDSAGIAVLLDRLTADRAGWLDKLNVAGTLANTANAEQFQTDVSGLLTTAAFDARIPQAIPFTDHRPDVNAVAVVDPSAVANAVDATLSAAHGAGPWGGGGGTGDGDTPVDHNTGGVDALQYTTGSQGADNAVIKAYLKSEYDAGNRIVRGTTFTGPDGRWIAPLMLNAGSSYYLLARIPGVTQTAKTEITL